MTRDYITQLFRLLNAILGKAKRMVGDDRTPYRMFKMDGRGGRSERRAETYLVWYVEGLSDARTKPTDIFNILVSCLDKGGNRVLRRLTCSR